MKKVVPILGILMLMSVQLIFGQATKSYPFAVGGKNNCGGSSQVHFYNYDGTTNIISNASGGLVAPCVPQLKYGTTNTQRFSNNLASISFNPKDHKIYFFIVTGDYKKTYAWSWDLGTCPGTKTNRLPSIQEFNTFILGVAFDNDGNAYSIEFTNAAPYKGMIRSIDFNTGTFGGADTLALTAGKTIIDPGGGDVVMTPSGQMFFAVDNRLYTPDYKSYSGTGANLTCTYIDTVITSTIAQYVGLTYAEGEMIAAYYGDGCPFYETNMVTAATSNITKSGGVYSGADLATVISGIGAAKKLVSVTPTGTAEEYDVVYDVYVQNYGNMDISNVQVTDDLTKINGAANVTNVSATFLSNPAGMVLNAGYNGNSNKNLLNGTGTLVNYPVANNNFTIRISCRLSNIKTGVVYNNSAIATAKDFNGNNLSDSSTNGSKPDLNSNDKPDDPGESRPTPLLISVTATTPPCSTLSQVLFKQDFGSGSGLTTTIPKASVGGVTPGTTGYTGTTAAPIGIEGYTLSNNAQNGDAAKWINLTDHTGNGNGRMLLVNADAMANVIYSDKVPTLCANQQYSLFFYAAFIGNSDYQTICNGFDGFKYPNITLQVRDQVTGAIIAQIPTGDITSTSWQQYGMKFVMPSGFPNVYIELVNNGEGGCGNDIAIDDIQFGLCDPVPVVNVGAVTDGCLGAATTFTSSLSDPGGLPGPKDYQWQIASSSAGPYTDISGATSEDYTIASVGAGDVGKYYRVIIAAQGNMTSPSCRYTSAGVVLTAKNSSVAASSAKANSYTACPGAGITLTAIGGTLGTNASWKWYSNSCGGTLIGTGTSIVVNPTVNTTYYVRAEGDCNITACQSVTITISCDIDKDKDGIPDWVESNMPEAFGDHDNDGIINAYDTDYPGFIDNNGDFINDWFQADGDVDGDGIPNYLDTDFPGRIDVNDDGVDDRFDADLDGIINMLDLDSDNDGIPDVVEAGGVDQDGDGKLDNFVDSDGDGLSDQVDANLNGAYNSGVGLGLKDTDGDGVPNQFDLDSDNDGIPDVREVGGADANNDGRIDGFIDANNDGISDHITGANALLRTGADTNGDGRANSYPYHNMDQDGVPNPYDLDSDGDGLADVNEAVFAYYPENKPDKDYNGQADGPIGPDGWVTTISSLPELILPNSDGDPNPDYLDIDSDNDGIPDNIEGPSTFDYKLPTGIDTDGDGLDDAYDGNPLVWGGRGVFIVDMDGDGIPDYRDLDTDGDGVPDIKEGHDYNFNGVFDEVTTLTGVDTDGDGLDDRFDLDNSSAKGTSSNLGNDGTTFGDASPGTKAVVQKSEASYHDRDWRDNLYVLKVNIVNFDAVKEGGHIALHWSIIASGQVTGFEVYRSTDNIHFTLVTKQQANVTLNELQHFSAQDEISQAAATSGIVFYRLHILGKERKMLSDVVRVKISSSTSGAKLVPNPARDRTTLHVQSKVEGNGMMKIMDKTGQIIYNRPQQIFRGQNEILISDLSRYTSGVYIVQLITQGEVISVKLVLIK